MSKLDRNFAFGCVLGKLLFKKYNFKYESLAGVQPPFLILSNHTTDYDPIMVSIAAQRPVHFVASEHMAQKGFVSWLVIKFLEPIIHQKGKHGLATTKAMIRYIKNGECVGLFPEGGRSFSGETEEILASTVKLVRSLKTTLVTVKIIGGYEVEPRWCVKKNPGHIELKLSGVYSPDEIKEMSDEQLSGIINSDLYVRAKLPADLTGIESTLFLAGPEAVGPDNNIPELCKAQQEFVMSGKGNFTDECRLYEVNKRHKVRFIRNIRLSADGTGFAIDGRPFTATGCAVVSRNKLILISDELHYEITGDIKFCALKYFLQFQYLNRAQKGEI